MAHFAQLDENNVVIQVIVVGDEYETTYAAWRKALGETYVQTSYNAAFTGFRKQYASIGYTYDPIRDEFVTPSPYPSWTLDANNDWQAPTAKPEGFYDWDESTLSWVPTFVG